MASERAVVSEQQLGLRPNREATQLPPLPPDKVWITACETGLINLTNSAGFWNMPCDAFHRDESGLTDFDRLWTAAKELISEGVLTQAAYIKDLRGWPKSILSVDFYVRDYLDINNVMKSATELRRRVFCSSVLYMNVRNFRREKKIKMIYMHCVDGDLYELELSKKCFKIIKRYS